MRPNPNKDTPERGFSTPPASWRSPVSQAAMPLSERKSIPSGCRRDLFHVVHKVPAGDSPYVRAKHVQLIDKDPSRAVSLFWAAINAGDRVDSALKDMAVVMKQLNRSDEAIEAIKSFRHLCPLDSQESLDNVLVELFKRCGRIEEEIEMLRCKLKNIEEGIAFGGKKTKTARSQGRKIQITVEQEKSRILGNLAWAYLQHHDYGLAEQYYRKALSLEPDYNKQCNLAICLMHMSRIPEAKSLLQAVSAAHGSKEMDDSYAKSFERALQTLAELDSKSVLRSTADHKDNHKSLASPAIEKLKEVSSSYEGGCSYVSGLMDTRKLPDTKKEESVLSDKCDRAFHGTNCSRNWSLSSQQAAVDSDWRKGNYFESPGKRSGISSKMKENWITSTNKEVGSERKKMFDSLGAALYTQPTQVPWRFSEGDKQARERLEEDTNKRQFENVMAGTIRNLDGELLAAKLDDAVSKSPSAERNSSGRSWIEVAQVKSIKAPPPEPRMRRHETRSSNGYNCYNHMEDPTVAVDGTRSSESSSIGKMKTTDIAGDKSLGMKSSTKSAHKSWADIADEEEQKLLAGEDLSPCFSDWNFKEECNDENVNTNINHQRSTAEIISQRQAFDLKDNSYDKFSNNTSSPRNPSSVRRSLCFDSMKGFNVKKNRLQVFRDITPSQDSP